MKETDGPMDSTESRAKTAEELLRISTARQLDYADRHRHVIALADHYGVGVNRIAEITELSRGEVVRILANVTDL